MKKIILATDFSPNAKNAVHFALDLFSNQTYRDAVEYFLVHVQAAPYSPIGFEAAGTANIPQTTDLIKQHETLLNAELEDIKQLYPFAKIQAMHLLGGEVGGLISFAQEKLSDLIVVGSAGKSLLGRAFIGSTTLGVTSHAHCPVLVVPDKATFKPFQRLVLATDMHESGDFSILSMMQNLVFNFEPEVYVVHVFGQKEQLPENRELFNHALKIYFNTNKYRYYYLENEDVAEGIGEFTSGHQADLLVMIGQNRNFFADLFHRSVTKKIVMHSGIPVLVLHNTDEKNNPTLSSTTEKKPHIKESLEKVKQELEELNVQLHLSKVEAVEELAEIKLKIKTWIGHTLTKIADMDDEVAIKLKNGLNAVNEKLSEWKADTADAFESQKEQINFAFRKVQDLFKNSAKDKSTHLRVNFEGRMDQLKTSLDELLLDINLGKMEVRDEWLENEQILRKKMRELRHKMNAIEEVSEEKWAHFKEEMSQAVKHAKKAFADSQ